MKQQILPLGLRVNLFEDDGKVKVEVAEADVAQGVGGGTLNVLVAVVETVEDDSADIGICRQVDVTADLTDGKETERLDMGARVGLQILYKPVHDGLGLVARPIDRQGSHALGRRGAALFVDGHAVWLEDGRHQETN